MGIFNLNRFFRFLILLTCYITRIRFATIRAILIALRGYRGKKIAIKYETPLSEVSYNLITAPMMEKIMCFENLSVYI